MKCARWDENMGPCRKLADFTRHVCMSAALRRGGVAASGGGIYAQRMIKSAWSSSLLNPPEALWLPQAPRKQNARGFPRAFCAMQGSGQMVPAAISLAIWSA